MTCHTYTALHFRGKCNFYSVAFITQLYFTDWDFTQKAYVERLKYDALYKINLLNMG